MLSQVTNCRLVCTATHITQGKISSVGFIPKQPTIASTRDTPSTSTLPVAPENVLFRSKKAPTRYAEFDIYFANALESRTNLPDSDLLKALHTYTSDFYSSTTQDGGVNDWRSLDATALLALGILMEEVCTTALGETGDLTFTEGEAVQSKLFSRQISSCDGRSSRSRGRKRRRLLGDAND